MRLEVGSIVEAKVTGITNFGAFVELPEGKKGMVHISEVAPTYVEKIADHLTVGQQVKVKVLSIGDDGKISLSIKKAMEREKPQVNSKKNRTSPQPAQVSKGPGSFEWQPKRNDGSFEDMLSRFKQTSDEKMSALKKGEVAPRRRKPQK
ncbi:MAG: S1 RNA-binding domain-containing protein [Acutalibacteraceae bacterium]